MKALEEILKLPNLMVIDTGEDGGMGHIIGLDPIKPNRKAVVVWSNGGGWDHVSVSWRTRCPTWEEMCRVKDMFFLPEETCIQFHPAKSEYVNFFPYCLHIWRPQTATVELPPKCMI